jgi:hypothetical protein
MEHEERTLHDLFGQKVEVGDYVIGGHGHELSVYKIIRITPKMVRIVNINAKTRTGLRGQLRYSNELFRIDEKLVTFYLMKQS